MKFKGTNKIITEDDIILSDGSNTLSERLSSQQLEIDQLKSNIKWIYKYGGVGSGGSGGGGSSQQMFSIYATLNNIQLKDQNIILDGQNSYPLYIKINNPNGATFNVQYTYTTRSNTGNNITQSQTVILSIENNYTLQTTINLNNNDTLTVVANNGNDIQQVFCNYVTSPYLFNTSIVDNNLSETQSEIFISNALQYGVNIKLDYTISVNADIQYKYIFKDKTITGNITDKNNYILFPIDSSLFTSENAGYYTSHIILNIVPENQDPIELQYDITFNLVPEDLYLLVVPDNGVIYKTEIENPLLFNPGYITFNYRVYEGLNNNRSYNVYFTLNEEEEPREYTVTERQINSLKLFTIKSGLNILDVRVTRTTTYTFRYYFYVAESKSQLDWLNWKYQYYYRISETTPQFSQYKNKSYISQTVNSDAIEITDIPFPDIAGNSIVNTHIAIGLQYNAINSEDPIILQFFNEEKGNISVLDVRQSYIEKDGITKNLYIKKQSDARGDSIEQYHLLQIYSQFVKQDGNEFYYAISFYLDGRLEATYPSIVNYPLRVNSLKINNVNCFINLLEVDYKEGELNNNCDYEVYTYFLKYQNTILMKDVSDQLQLKNYLSNFNVSLNGRITTNRDTINNIAQYVSTPVMLLTCQDTDKNAIERLEQNYGEDGSGAGSDYNFDVTVSWSSGKNSIEKINLSTAEYPGAQFNAAIQGSSTKAYRVKNFELSLKNKDEGSTYNYLFSPNFKDGDTSTFLPEASFTLKADIVDSSHSNNTSCGKFINTVCRSTNYYINDTSYYSNYIKNCLEGFPILLFLETVQTDDITGEEQHTYYYFGVYNFNLGRSSYYNLGYKDLSVFGSANNKLLNDAGNSFTFFRIDKSQDILREGLGVAEIQGGSPYFDFSQSDPSILFQQQLTGSTDNTYMFGDLVYGSNSTEQQLQSSLQNLVSKISLAGGYLFNYLKKSFGLQTDGYTAEKIDTFGQYTGESLNQVPDYHKQYKRELSGSSWKYSIKETISDGTLNDLQELIIPDIDTGKVQLLDFQSISEYYVICMVLGLVDSVQKNLNLKKWKNSPYLAQFYDMDSGLGTNNKASLTNYFAFSDYWHSQFTTEDGVDKPTNVRIYRDFSPHSQGENGYDIPSSYLFAVAKYAKLLYPNEDTYTKDYPQQLYSRWRSNTVNTVTQEGVLKNADSFMDNFFSNNLGAINPILVSYNYRSKYLKIDEGQHVYVNTDYEKFNGTRINQVRDWMEGRLHIMDAYFNLNSAINNSIQYLDNGTWKDLVISGQSIIDSSPDGTYKYTTNPDVVILRDIFSSDTSSSGVQLSGNVSINIKCPEYSPLQIYNANGSILLNYILGGEREQNIKFTTTGVQAVKLGGSQAWTYLQNINWLSATSLYINSDKLENITGSSGSFSAIQLNTPNVNTIDLTSANYSGTLTLLSSESYPNLKSVNISRTKMGLVARNLNVQSINLANVNSTSTVEISGCSSLTSLDCTNTKLGTLKVIGIKGTLKKFTLQNTNINNIELQCSDAQGSVTIKDDSSVQSITLQGFETVTILNCPKLTKIIFNQSDIKNITINNCSNVKLAISSTTLISDTIVDLSTLTSLQTLNLNGCSEITKIYLPPNVRLTTNAFRNLSKLKSLDGENIQIDGSQIFYNCNAYALRDSNGNYSDLHVLPTVTSLAYCFYKTSATNYLLTLEDARHFIETAVPITNNITSVYRMFYQNRGIVYNLDSLKEDLAGGTNYLNLTRFNKVTDARGMFGYCAITAYYKEMWNLGGSEVNLDYFCEPAHDCNLDKTIHTTLDLLTNIISKVTILFGTANNNRYRTVFVDNSGNIITDEIQLKDFFNPNGIAPSKLKELTRFYLDTTQIVDLKDTFTSSWSNLTSIKEFMWVYGQKYKSLDYLFYYLPKITTLYDVFYPSALEDRTNLFTIFNWKKYLKTTNRLFSDCSSDSLDTGTFLFKKYISADDYKTLCNLILQSTITDISYLFNNCNIINYFDTFTFGSITTVNSTIKYIRGLYRNCKIVNNEETSSMAISKTFFSRFRNIVDVRYAFQNCIFSQPIPFNFFNKRQINQNEIRNVYVKVNGEYKNALLTTYTYRKEIYCYTSIFQGCQFLENSNYYNPTLYTIDRNTVLSEGEEYTTYYVRQEIEDEFGNITYNYIKQTLTQPTEITDAENLVSYYESSVYTDESRTYSNAQVINPNNLCIPPDLFYGTASKVESGQGISNVDYSFALNCATRLEGIIPEHIFQYNRNGVVRSTFKDQSITPRLIKTIETDDSIINVYSHYPSNYTSYTDLTEAFNSRYVVPQNSSIGNKLIYNWVFIILQDSISNKTTSLEQAFNCTSDDNLWWNGQRKEDRNYINCIGKIENNTVIEGLDMSVFKNLKLDRVYYTRIMAIGHGRLFNDNFDAKNIKRNNINYQVIYPNHTDLNMFSACIIFPNTTGSINNILIYPLSYELKSNQLLVSSSKQYYEEANIVFDKKEVQ